MTIVIDMIIQNNLINVGGEREASNGPQQQPILQCNSATHDCHDDSGRVHQVAHHVKPLDIVRCALPLFSTLVKLFSPHAETRAIQQQSF